LRVRGGRPTSARWCGAGSSNEPDFAWFAQYDESNARAYAIAAGEAYKAGLMIFGHTDDAPGSLRDGMDIIEPS
jgi:hypothetical protein